MKMSESTIIPADFDGDAFDDWIAGATVSKRSVEIYGKPGLYAEFQELEREAERLEALGAQEEMAGGELARIERRMQEIHDEHQASKSTWTVRALTDEQVDEVRSREPALVEPEAPVEPRKPAPLPAKHSPAEATRFGKECKEYDEAMAVYKAAQDKFVAEFKIYSREVGLRCVAEAVERIEFANGRVSDGITVEQLRAMRATLALQVDGLAAAAQLAAVSEPEIPAPFSRSSSESDPTS